MIIYLNTHAGLEQVVLHINTEFLLSLSPFSLLDAKGS